MHHWRVILAVLAVVTAVAVSGVAYARIADSQGVIHGCYTTKTGALRVIDTDAGQTCVKSEQALTWNQTGPHGPAGPPGVSDYQIQSRWFDVNPTTNEVDRMAGVIVLCPTGWRVLGGGGGSTSHAYPAREDVVLHPAGHIPPATKAAWLVQTRRLGDALGGYSIESWAICAKVS